MPIVWRYLLQQYFKVFSLSVFSFIAILLISQLKEIAHFAALGSHASLIFRFALYLIPYILPIAIPISCLIASMLLYQQLSRTHELTALRACGMGIRQITAPVLVLGAFIALINFYVASELATKSHLLTRKMENEIASVNPLLLLQNRQLLQLKEIYVDMDTLEQGESAQDVLFVVNNRNSQRLNVMSAKKLQLDHSILLGTAVSIISSVHSDDLDNYDTLIIENQKTLTTRADEFSQLMKKSEWRLTYDYLQMHLLLSRIEQQRGFLKAKVDAGHPPESIQDHARDINLCHSEIIRRLSLGFAAFSFTLVGSACGMQISRIQKKKGLYFVVGLVSFFLICFFTAKGVGQYFALAATLYLLPHILLVALAIWALTRISRGLE